MRNLTHRAGARVLAISIALTMVPVAAGAAPLLPAQNVAGASDAIQVQGQRWLNNQPGARIDNRPDRRVDRRPDRSQTRNRDNDRRWDRDRRHSRNWDRDRRHSRSWDRSRHGPRYRHRRPGYTHFHDGYYYATPWWLAAGAIGAFIGSQVQQSGNNERAHDDWCDQRYRSYNRSTNTYMGYDGQRHYCNSPYGNR